VDVRDVSESVSINALGISKGLLAVQVQLSHCSYIFNTWLVFAGISIFLDFCEIWTL